MRFIAMASRLIKPGDLFASGGSRPLAEKSPPSQGIILYGEGYTGLDLFDLAQRRFESRGSPRLTVEGAPRYLRSQS
jgi:hypothetical protein